jgi:hypothetical protein
MPDDKVLGPEWGALAGKTEGEALRIMAQFNREQAQELARAKDAQASGGESDPPKKTIQPDFETIRGEDQDAATKALEEYTTALVTDLHGKRVQEDRERTFPQDRARAIRDAQQYIANLGMDWGEEGKQLETVMSDTYKVPRDQQVNSESWINAYKLLVGDKAMRGELKPKAPVEPANPYVARPNPTRVPTRTDDVRQYEMPEEEHTHRMFEKQLGKSIPKEEWFAFRDDIRSQEDYERYQAEQAKKARK